MAAAGGDCGPRGGDSGCKSVVVDEEGGGGKAAGGRMQRVSERERRSWWNEVGGSDRHCWIALSFFLSHLLTDAIFL